MRRLASLLRVPGARGEAAVALLLSGTVALFLAPVLFLGRVFFLKDAQLWFYPSRLLLRSRLWEGDLPLWVPELELGKPFLADPANGVLYPLNLLLLLPAPACVGQFLAAHLILATLGAYALARALGLGRPAGCAAGLGYGLGGYLLSMASWSGVYVLSVAWMPLSAALALQLVRRRRILDLVLLALVLACQVLTGEVQGVAFTGLLSLVLVLAEPLAWRQRLTGLGLLALAAFVAVLLALPQILPTLDLLPQTRRADGLDLSGVQHFSLHPLRLLELLVPWLLGEPSEWARYLGFFMNDEGRSVHRLPWILSPYVGSLVVVLAAVGLAVPRRAHRRWVWGLGALGVLCLLVALGRHLPLFALLHQHVPGASLFRWPAKYFAPLALILPLAAAAGLEACVTADAAGRRGRGLLGGLTLLVLAALLGAAALAGPAGAALQALRPEVTVEGATDTVRWAVLHEAGVLAALGFALWLVARRWPSWLGVALTGALLLQLASGNAGIQQVTDPAIYNATPPLAARLRELNPPGEPLRLLRRPGAFDRAYDDAFSAAVRAEFRTHSLVKNLGPLFGVGYPDVYGVSRRETHRAYWASTQDLQPSLLGLHSVAFLLLPPAAPVRPESDLELVAGLAEEGLTAYRLGSVLPFVRPVAAVTGASSIGEALGRIRQPAVRRGELAVIEGLPAAAREIAEVAAVSRDACHAVRPSGDAIRVRCALDRDAWVVINEGHHPHWEATLEGRPVPVHRANALVMAVFLPRGEQVLELVYREPGLSAGGRMAGGVLGALLAALWLSHHRRRRRGDER